MPGTSQGGLLRRAEWLLFVVLFVSYAYFHQGGGWHQNARFDQVRSIAESGELFINRYAVYTASPSTDGTVRVKRESLPDRFSGATPPALNTWDVAFHDGRFYPNKPPGGTLIALPGYWSIRAVEIIARVDPDDVRTLTANAYLTSVLSVALLGALGGVLFLRLSRRLFPEIDERGHIASALTFGLATLMLPYGTLLFDQVPVAVFLLAAFYFLVVERSRATRLGPWLAGLFCGLAVLGNYSAVLPVAILCAYAVLVLRPWIRLWGLLMGGALPAIVLLGYHWICFGNPFTLANTYQNRMFNEPGALVLGVLGVPDPSIAGQLLFSAYRGLFFSSPVLALSSYGLARMARQPDRRAEALLIGTVFAAMLLMNASFNGWHGGWCFGPRYLVPAVPFLALPLALAWSRWPRVTAIAASVSGTILLGVTSITVMIPQGFSSPYRNFLLPLAAGRNVDTPIYRYRGPVSVNPAGIVPSGGPEDWASFNLGELVWPRSWLSLVPLLAVVAVAVVALARTTRHRSLDPQPRRARRAGRDARRPPPSP